MNNNNCILVLTALPVERDAVIKHLTDAKVERHPDTGTDYHRGFASSTSGKIPVIVGRTDQTNINAAVETERALEYYKPSHAFYVGVAGGLKDVKVGDIVVGNDVLGYERGKAEDESFKPRPQFGASSYDLERAANAYSISADWKAISSSLVDVEFAPEITVLSGTIASGEKVDASYKSALHKHIKLNASHALAIEMEGLGFLTVCRSRPAVKSLLVRGISDLVNDKGAMDDKGSQPYASQNVAAFLFGFISTLDLSNVRIETSKTNQTLEIVCKLYPRGVEDRKIWERAGGDLSFLTLSTQGKGQWFDAIKLLEQGGGGSDIDLNSLIQAMQEDFPKNTDLIGAL
ncbi:Nucleoside phosphorylase [Mariprofundus aestuarium]|uniref:Nucleoside phosphorylase n=1 Tax=Mariprofundus aestuarium TaxID=1921086 RepID=A0A2K8L083_MARES|nr:effector-associated domain EAD1-containing protein [Mariprofundus aestuarium]ATX80700.1 Nucleoside phosphorylase [Mariprofundus aestuarium]